MKAFIINHKKGLTAAVSLLTVFALALGIAPTRDAEAGWFPTRNMKTYSAGVPGFDVPTFNSFKNTNTFGDERTFFEVTKDGDNSNFKDSQKVAPGDTVILRAYIHNGADPSKNASGAGVAKNTRVKVYLPTGTGTSFKTYGYVSADNARYYNGSTLVTRDGKPVVTVTDSADITSDVPVRLEYINGSAKLYNHANNVAGHSLSNSIVTHAGTVDPTVSSGGAKIGYSSMDGNLPGCFEYEGYVFVRAKVVSDVKPDTHPGLKVTKKVKVEGTNTWFDANDKPSAVQVQPGDTLAYLIKWENTGDTKLTNVVIRDSLPPSVTLVPGSVRYIDASNPDPGVVKSDALTAGGLKFDQTAVGAGAYLRFNAKVPTGLSSGTWTFTNVAYADSDQTNVVEDKAVVQTTYENVGPTGGIIEKAKTSFNETQGLDATLIPAHENDLVNYTLTTKNSGDAGIDDFVIDDDISDILAYATVVNFGGGSLDGTTIKWPAQDVAAGEIVSKTFTVKIKPANQWPNGGDLILTNVYGNSVNVHVDSNPITPFGEPVVPGGATVAALPSTGPEDFIPVIGLFAVMSLVYFYRKSKRNLALVTNTKIW